MKTYLLLFILFITYSVTAQLNPKTKWGDVSQAEIDYKEVSFEKDAPAVVLFEEGKSVISGSVQTRIFRRIKILNEQGIEAANQELLYYNFRGRESFGSFKAQTINIENGKPVTYAVDRNSIFDVTVNEYYNARKFTFPNLKVGSIIEFEYNFINQDLGLFEAWQFQHEYPTIYSQFEIKNEMRLDYTSLMIGEKIVQYSRGKKDLDTWKLTNIPSFNALEFVYNKEDMAERIVFQLRGYMKSSGFDGSSSTYENVLSNWKELNKEMENNYVANRSQSVGKEIAASIPNGKNELETLQNVYNHFKENYKWSNFYNIYVRESNRNVQKNRTGNAADLNLLLNTILNSKNIKAELALLSTRHHGKIITSYPYLGQFNLVLNVVTLKDGSTYLIDASDMSFDVGYAPLRDYNHFALIVDSKEDRFINLHPVVSEYHSIQNYNFKDGKFLLTRNDKRNGYFKENKREIPKGAQRYNPQKNSLDIFVNELRRDARESEEDNFEMERIISESVAPGSFMNIENPLRSVVSQFQLKEQNRERALEFNFPFYYKTDVVIEIPDGYKVEIPQNFNVHNQTSAKDLVYFQSAEIKDGKLLMHIEFYLGKAVYYQNYAQIKAFFDKTNLDVNKDLLLKKN